MLTYRVENCRQINLRDLHIAMVGAFSDYIVPMQPTFEQFMFMMRQRGYSDRHSYVVLDPQNQIASFWLCAAPGVSLNVYTIATGTLPHHRRKGLLAKILSPIIETLKSEGVAAISLEVIGRNTAARTAYSKLGFAPKRDLLCWSIPAGRQTKRSASGRCVEQLALRDLPGSDEAYFDFAPTPQNSREAMTRIRDDVKVLACVDKGEIAGWGVLIRPTNTISQLTVRRDLRRGGIGTAIFSALAEETSGPNVQMINTEASDRALSLFLKKRRAHETARQLEMYLKISS